MSTMYLRDWWNHPLPDYLGQHKENFVLTTAEVEAFAAALTRMNTIVNSEGRHVMAAFQAMKSKHVPAGHPDPTPVVLNDVLGIIMAMGKTSQYLLEVANAIAKNRNEAAEAANRG